MKYNRIFLISPKIWTGRFQISFYPPAGLGYLAQVLERDKISYDILDMNLGYNPADLKDKILAFKPDLLAISMMTFMYKDSYELIWNIKKIAPDVKIIAGGPHISTFGQKVFSDCPELDYAVVMEGEEALVELCQGREISEIKGLIHRQDGQVVFNGQRGFIVNLDNLPFPRYHKFDLKNYPTAQLGVVTSRGCPFNCIFCPVNTAIGKAFRYRSPENIIEELEYWYAYGRREFLFLDDNFTLIPERVYKICELIAKRGLSELRLKCPNGVRADRVDINLLKEMKKAGFVMLAFGVEAGNDKILKNIRKGEKIEQIERAIKNACDLGFEVELFFLIGSPGESASDVKDSFNLAQRYPIRSAKFYNLIPFPQTELYDWVSKNGYFTEDHQSYLNNSSHFVNKPCFKTPEMSIEERRRMFGHAQKISRKIRRRSLESRLKKLGYFSKIAAFIYTIGPVERLAVENRILLRLKKIFCRSVLNEHTP